MSTTNTIQKVRNLCALLVQESLSPEDLANELGSVQPGGVNQYTVSPNTSEFQSVMVVPASDGKDVNFVRLTLTDSLPFSAFESAFGEYNTMPPKPKKAPTAQFVIDSNSATHRVTLLVSLDGQDVKQLTLRRDIRLG